MPRLLIFAGLALAVQALPLEPGSTTESPTTHPFLSADLINKHMLMGWSLPQPGPGSRPTREAPAIPPEATTEHPFLSADLINKHMLMGWSLPQPGPGSRPTREAPAVPLEATTAHPFLSTDLINKHMLMGWSLPQPGPGSRPTREAPAVPLEATTAHPFLSSDLINKHMLMGWSLPQPGPGPRPTREAPVITSEPTASTEPNLTQNGPSVKESKTGTEAISASSEPIRSLYSPEWIKKHMLMGWSLPEPGPGTDLTSESIQESEPSRSVQIRSIRSAPRALPAHKAHGPRAILPYGLYARKNTRG